MSPDPDVQPQHVGGGWRQALPNSFHSPSRHGDKLTAAPMNGTTNEPPMGADGDLPIHALLPGERTGIAVPPSSGYDSTTKCWFENDSSALVGLEVERCEDGDVIITAAEDKPEKAQTTKVNPDGMSALLRAGEIFAQYRC